MFPLYLQALLKIHLADHIHSLAELLHTDALQQLGVALLGSLAVNLINILLVSLQSMSSMQHQAVPLQPSVTTFMSLLPPTIPIVGVTDTKEPAEATATSSGGTHHQSASIYFQCQFQPQLKGLAVHLAHSLPVPLLLCSLLWFLSEPFLPMPILSK